jgi:hypothetical protein
MAGPSGRSVAGPLRFSASPPENSPQSPVEPALAAVQGGRQSCGRPDEVIAGDRAADLGRKETKSR